jgi:hypothetical protein
MVSHLFFYQLTLIALVWLCVILQWAWPSDSAAACPTTLAPHPHGHSAIVSTHPLQASPPSRPATPVSTPPLPARSPPQLRHLASCPRGGAAARLTPRCISARTRPVPIAAGWAGAISGPMAIPVAVPGGSCCVWSVVAIFSRPSARSCTASAGFPIVSA